MKIGKREFHTKQHTYVMGILNVTPDSFSDGGAHGKLDDALFHAEKMLNEGADIIDIGGESTRPGFIQISDQEEMERILPVIEKLRKELDPVISVDTYKSEVAREAALAGADMINDIWGFQYDGHMAEVVARHDLACCLMHNRKKPIYDVFMKDVVQDLKRSLTLAKEGGVGENKILLDPGVGFAKTLEMNLEVMRELDQIVQMGYPVLLGTSRKSMIGLTLDLPVDQRLEGTIATTVYGVMKGCSFVRVHDVTANKRAIAMIEAIQKP